MKARWLPACGLLLLVGVVAIARTRAGHPDQRSSSAVGSPSRSVAANAAAARPSSAGDNALSGRRGFRQMPLRARAGGTNAARALDDEIARMAEGLERSRTARLDAQRLTVDDLGLDAADRDAISAIFDEERHGVVMLEGTPEAMSDAAHGNLIEQRKRRLAELLGPERADEFQQLYLRHWLDALSAEDPSAEDP